MFPMGNTGQMNLQDHQEANGRHNYPKAQVCGVRGRLSLRTMGNVEDHSIWFLSYLSLFMCEEASLGELEDTVHPMTSPQLIRHWKVRAQQISRMHFHMVFPTAPCRNKGVQGEGRSCAKRNPALSPSRRGDGSVQMRPSRPEEWRCLVSITHHAVAVVQSQHPQM